MLLAGDPAYEPLTRQVAATGQEDGYRDLILAALSLAARRRFGPGWQPADVIHYTASLRIRLRRHGIELEPRPAENLVQNALHGRPVTDRNATTLAETLILVLADLASDRRVTPDGLDAFIATARTIATPGAATAPRTSSPSASAPPPPGAQQGPLPGASTGPAAAGAGFRQVP
jgi:hypothetical protein